MADTPSRMTRSRANTPGPTVQPKSLPSLQTKASTSYGSRGKATLHSQTAATASISQFEDAFSSARNQAQETATPKRRGRKPKAVEEETVSVEEETSTSTILQQTVSMSEEVDDSRPSTALDAGAMYERPLSFVSSMLPPSSRRTTTRAESPLAAYPPVNSNRAPSVAVSSNGGLMLPPASRKAPSQQHTSSAARSQSTADEVEEPWSIRVFFSTLTRYFPELVHDSNPTIKKWAMKWLGIIGLLTLGVLAVASILFSLANIYSVMPLPQSMQQPRDNFVAGMRHAFGLTTTDQVVERLSQASADLQRLEELKKMFDESRKTLVLQDQALEELRGSLPEVVVVEKVNGKVELTQDFWTAFEQKLNNSKGSPLWKALLRAQEHDVREMISEDSKATFVTKEEYIGLVRHAIDQRFGDVLAHVEQTASKVAATISREVTEEYMRKNAGSFTREDRLALEKFTRIQAAYDALSTVNFFDPGLGASIVPKLTSSTQAPPARSWSSYLKWSYSDLILIPQYAPIEALTSVNDASSCWCAAPSTDRKGRAQITIRTPVAFYPDTLVIEHIPSSGTLDITTAPKNFEVWVDLGSADAVSYMRRKIAYFDGNDRSGECGPAPTPNFLCVYRGAYDKENDAHPAQAFKLWYPIERLDMATDVVSVRITENWGAEWTCLYRLRMTGSRTDGNGAIDYYGEPKDGEGRVVIGSI